MSKRTANYSAQEKSLLIAIVGKHKHIIESKESNASSLQQKNNVWQRIAREFNARSGQPPRDSKQIKTLYFNLKRKVKKNVGGEHSSEYLKDQTMLAAADKSTMIASEQFSLSWNNFHKIMNLGINSMLENEDFVNVTLAVEGRYLKAHKMILSVCSPYFKELFKTNPCKHPIVFMKDVSYSAMSDLLEFMYKGEVQVNEESFNTFIKTAESLQIMGLSNYGSDSAQYDTECQRKKVKLTDSEVQTLHETPQISPSKRLRLDHHTDPMDDKMVKTEQTVLEESVATPSFNSGSISLKTEPYDDEESSFRTADDGCNENDFDDPLGEVDKPIETDDDCSKDNINIDENNWVMQDDDEVDTKDTTLTGAEGKLAFQSATSSEGDAMNSLTSKRLHILKREASPGKKPCENCVQGNKKLTTTSTMKEAYRD